MEFEYTDSIWIEPYQLREMFLLCKKKGYTPQEAVNKVGMGLDDADFYRLGAVEDQIIAEIERRLKQSKSESEKAKQRVG